MVGGEHAAALRPRLANPSPISPTPLMDAHGQTTQRRLLPWPPQPPFRFRMETPGTFVNEFYIVSILRAIWPLFTFNLGRLSIDQKDALQIASPPHESHHFQASTERLNRAWQPIFRFTRRFSLLAKTQTLIPNEPCGKRTKILADWSVDSR
jgi:hypothetical protein